MSAEEEKARFQRSRLFSIHETDLAAMEQLIPDLYQRFMTDCGPVENTKFRHLQRILSDVRWDYGPHSAVEQVE